MYGGSASFKIGIHIVQSDCSTAVQASATYVIETLKISLKKKNNK